MDNHKCLILTSIDNFIETQDPEPFKEAIKETKGNVASLKTEFLDNLQYQPNNAVLNSREQINFVLYLYEIYEKYLNEMEAAAENKEPSKERLSEISLELNALINDLNYAAVAAREKIISGWGPTGDSSMNLIYAIAHKALNSESATDELKETIQTQTKLLEPFINLELPDDVANIIKALKLWHSKFYYYIKQNEDIEHGQIPKFIKDLDGFIKLYNALDIFKIVEKASGANSILPMTDVINEFASFYESELIEKEILVDLLDLFYNMILKIKESVPTTERYEDMAENENGNENILDNDNESEAMAENDTMAKSENGNEIIAENRNENNYSALTAELDNINEEIQKCIDFLYEESASNLDADSCGEELQENNASSYDAKNSDTKRKGIKTYIEKITSAAEKFKDEIKKLEDIADKHGKIPCFKCMHYNPPGKVCQKCGALLPYISETEAERSIDIKDETEQEDKPVLTSNINKLFTAIDQTIANKELISNLENEIAIFENLVIEAEKAFLETNQDEIPNPKIIEKYKSGLENMIQGLEKIKFFVQSQDIPTAELGKSIILDGLLDLQQMQKMIQNHI